jgi:hypothetical protein
MEDTVQYYYEDTSGKPYYIRFRINSNISFKTDVGEHVLYSVSSEIVNDLLVIYLTKQTFGLIIDTNIYVQSVSGNSLLDKIWRSN